MYKIRKHKMFFGWWIVILSCIGMVYGGATIWYGFTAYFTPFVKEFAWSYAAISLAASIRGAETGLMDVVVGFLFDRFSARIIILGGAILIGCGWLILSAVNSLATFYVAFFVICTGATGISSVIFVSLVSRWFNRRLGLAIGLVSAGAGAGGLAVPGIVYLLDNIGFRNAFVIFGIVALVIGVVTSYFIRNWPKDIGSVPDGIIYDPDEPRPEGRLTVVTTPSEHNFKEAVAKFPFWIITYISTSTIFTLMLVSTHIMPYLEHLGYVRQTAGLMAMLIPVISICGRLGTGWISDRISHRAVLIGAILGELVGIILLTSAYQLSILIPSLILFSVSFGGILVLRVMILRRYFGSSRIGSFIGLCMGISSFGGIAGPLFGGWIFDMRGEYSFAWFITGILLLAGLPLAFLLKQPKEISSIKLNSTMTV